MHEDISARSKSFAREHLTWIAVRHFLSADLLQELSRATLDVLTEGSVSLDDLFETARTGAPPELISWFAYPRETTGPKDRLLQDLVRFLVWNSDYAIWSPAKDASPRETEMLNGIRTAFDFASLDLGTIAQHREAKSFPEPLSEFVDAISSLATVRSGSTADEVVTILTPVASRFETPLNAIVLKHLGDLCADADRWQHAIEAYSYATRILPEARGAWSDLIRALRGIIEQSQVAAIWMLEGADAAMPAYDRLIRQGSLSSNPLPLFNAMVDALNASFLTKEQDSLPDRRVAQGVAPLLLDTLDLNSALASWRREQHGEAHKAFWATLRRQTALGSISASRSTKALYGECLIEHARLRQDRHSDRSLFQLGIRLLIESGHAKTVDRIAWPERLVADYVDSDLVAAALEQTRNAPGIADERSRVVLTLLKCWVLTLPRGLIELARTMLETLARAAAELDGSSGNYRKSATVALEGLSTIARKRPEFMPLAAGSIAGAIVAQLEKGGLLDAGDAVTLAVLMVEAFDEEALLALINATLNRLAMFEPSRSPWPVVRPAISFLSSRRILDLCSHHPKLQRNLPTTLVTFALESETEYASLLYLLRDIDPSWIDKDAIAPRIDEVIAQLRKRASEIRSSRAPEDIAALLVAPAFSGSAGVSDALDALRAIVQTAADGRPALSFDSSWHPLMMAADNLDVIVRDTELSAEDLAGRLNAIATALVGVWHRAGEVPLIFAGFAIPRRTAPSAVIVHNWTFASVGLGRLLGREAEMAQALEIAARQPALQGPIALAKAVRFAAGDQGSLDATSIREEEKDAFYAALGKRLLMLSDLPADIRMEITSVLFEQCLRLGPSGLDAGVFVVAIDQDFDRAPLAPEVRAYRRRLDNDSDLRISLASLLEAVVPRGVTTEL